MPAQLLHNWKFNGNTFDSVNLQVTTGPNVLLPGMTGVDLIIQPELQTLLPNFARSLSETVTSVTFPDRLGGKYLKWDGTMGVCSAHATVGKEEIGSRINGIFDLYRNYNHLITCYIKFDGTITPGFLLTSAAINIEVNYSVAEQKFTLNNIPFGVSVTQGQWYFVAIYFDGVIKNKLYVSLDNGVRTAVDFPASFGQSVDIFQSIYTFDGLYDLRIYSYVEETDIVTIYNNGNVLEIPDNIGQSYNLWKYPFRHHLFEGNTKDQVYINNPAAPQNTYAGPNTSFVPGKISSGISVGRDSPLAQTYDRTYTSTLAPTYNKPLSVGQGNRQNTKTFWIGAKTPLTAPGTYDESYVDFDGFQVGFNKTYGYGSVVRSFGLPKLAVYPNFDHYIYVYYPRYSRHIFYINGIPRAQYIYTDSSIPGPNAIFYLGNKGACVVDDLRVYSSELAFPNFNAIYSSGVGTQTATQVINKIFKTSFYKAYFITRSHNTQRAVIGAVKKQNNTNTFLNCGWFNTNTLIIGGLYQSLTIAVQKEIEQNHTSHSILQASYDKSHTTDSYNVYKQEYNSITDNLLIKMGILYQNTDILLLKENESQHSIESLFYTARDHISDANLYLPHYLYADAEIKAFKNLVKAKYSAPKALPAELTKQTITGSVKPLSHPKFPINPTDGQLFIDNYGNRWTYSISSDSWISKGDAGQPNIASDDINGVITPEIYDKLEYLRTIGKLPNYLKISPLGEAYYYYFRSSDKLIDFIPEENNKLRIEINQSRLFANLYRQLCPGIRGEQGDIGDRGDTGLATAEELTYIPKVENNLIKFLAFTHAPLKLNGILKLPNDHVPYISVRLYALTETGFLDDPLYYQKNYLPRYYLDDIKNTPYINKFLTYIQNIELGLINDNTPIPTVLNPNTETVTDNVLAEIYIDPTGTYDNELIYVDERISLNAQATLNSFIYDETNCFVKGTFIFSESKKPYTFAVRTMQMGPDGNKGAAGINCIQLTNNILTNQSIVATAPIINIRYDSKTRTFFTFSASLTENSALRNSLCAKYLRLLSGNNSLNDRPAFDTAFISAETTLRGCKLITSYKPSLRSFDTPDLDLKNWQPTGEISQSKNWLNQNFPWYTAAGNIPASCTKNAKSALNILGALSNSPPDQGCCQEPFVYFPAIQDGPCSNETTGINPIPSPGISPTPSPSPSPVPTPTPPTPTPPTPTPPTPTPPTPTPPTPTPPTPTPPTPTQAGCDKYGQCNLRPLTVKVDIGNQEASPSTRTTYVIQPGGKIYSSYNKNCVATLYPKGLTKNAKSFIQTLKSFIPYGEQQFDTGPIVPIISPPRTRTITSNKTAISQALSTILPQALEITYGDMSKPLPDGCPGPSYNPASSSLNLVIVDAYSYIDAACSEIAGCQGYQVIPWAGVYIKFYIEWVLDGISILGAEWDLSEASYDNPDKITLKTPGTRYMQEVKFELLRTGIDLLGIRVESNKPVRGCPTSEYITIPARSDIFPPITRPSTWRFVNRT